MSEKIFRYDVLLEEEDICNLTQEKNKILKCILKKEKMVVFGRRNSGKTSLVKNVIIPHFKKQNKSCFILFVDLMEVKDLTSLSSRLRIGFQQAFQEAFPKKAFLESVKKYIQNLKPTIEINSVSGETGFTILPKGDGDHSSFKEILEIINLKIAKEVPTLLVIDEFQDAAFVAQALGLLRNELQSFKDVPVILMGSKKHLLAEIFAKPNAPFADFGVDIEFSDIPYQEYHLYMQERLERQSLEIDFETAKVWQDLLFRNPEAINMVGATLVDHFKKMKITHTEIHFAIHSILDQRQARYRELISQFSSHEENLLTAIAKYGPVAEPSSKNFLDKVKPSHATVLKIVKKLLDHSILEKTNDGYRLHNPLLHFFLIRNS